MAVLAVGLLPAVVAAVAVGCRPAASQPEPVSLYDVEGWPPFDRFLSPRDLAGEVRITATVTLAPTTRSGPDSKDPANPGRQVPWRDLAYEVRIEPVGGKVLQDVVVGVKLNEAMAPWVFSGMLAFGTDAGAPVDVGPGTDSPTGLLVGRVTAVPDPSVLSEEERRIVKAALQTPIWLKITWDGFPRYVRLEPGQDIRYQGLEALE